MTVSFFFLTGEQCRIWNICSSNLFFFACMLSVSISEWQIAIAYCLMSVRIGQCPFLLIRILTILVFILNADGNLSLFLIVFTCAPLCVMWHGVGTYYCSDITSMIIFIRFKPRKKQVDLEQVLSWMVPFAISLIRKKIWVF